MKKADHPLVGDILGGQIEIVSSLKALRDTMPESEFKMMLSAIIERAITLVKGYDIWK